MRIDWPQGIMLAIVFLNICVHASRNGEPRDGHYDLGASMLSAAITIGLLWWGGFFA